MPWTKDEPPDVAKNWTDDERAKCVEAANAALADGASDEDAVFACIAAAGKSEEGEAEAEPEAAQDAQPASGARFLRAYARVDKDMPEDAPVRFVASTEGVKRDGLDLKAESWDLSNYKRHPVVVWAHDYSRLPIGRADVSFEGKTMLADMTYDMEDEFARQVRSKAVKGLVAASVAWNQRKDGKNELLEISNVPVPADPDALAQTQRAGLRAMATDILQTLAEETGGTLSDESVWCGVGLAMRGLFEHADGTDENARRKVYNDLARLYKRLEKTPPEFIEAAQLRAMTEEQRRGLMLEDEMTIEQRYGVVLSKRVKGRLSEAKTYLKGVSDIIQEVLDSAEPKQEEAADPELARILNALNILEVKDGNK